MTPSHFVRVTSTAAAKVFNIYPQKGRIEPGADADVIVLDPRIRHVISAATHHSRIDTNLYEGRTVTGKVRGTDQLDIVQKVRCRKHLLSYPMGPQMALGFRH